MLLLRAAAMLKGTGPDSSHDKAAPKAQGPQTQPREPTVVNPMWQMIALGAQAKLAIGSPDDPLEDEADRIAEQIVSGNGVTSPEIASTNTVARKIIQREQASPAEEPIPAEEIEPLQRKFIGGMRSSAADDLTDGVHRLQGRGEPLADDVKSYFEPRFGADLSGVRIHADGEANQLAQSINAKAFTVGSDIAFGAGQYSPDSHAGKTLLAHELTHTLQQGAVTPGHQSSSDGRSVSQSMSAANTIQRDPKDDKKFYSINKVTINGDLFDILLTHYPIDGNVSIRVTYVGKEEYSLESVTFHARDASLKAPIDRNEYYVQEFVAPGTTKPHDHVVYLPYKDRPDITVGIEDPMLTNDKWVPPHRSHEFFGTVSGVETPALHNTTIQIIPRDSIPATVSEPEYTDIAVPQVPELGPKQALLGAQISLQEIIDNQELYQLQSPDVPETFVKLLDDQIKNLDPTKDNSDAARTGTGMLRAADYFKQKAPSMAIFLLPGYFPPNISDEATKLVRDVHGEYETGLIYCRSDLAKTNVHYKSGDAKLLRLQYRLSDLFLKRTDGGLDTVASEMVSFATDISNFRSSAGVAPNFAFLDQRVLGIQQDYDPSTGFPVDTPSSARDIREQTDSVRQMHRDADPGVFSKVMAVASRARGFKSIFSMVAVYELLRFYRKGYYGGGSWLIDAVLPGSGQKTVDGYIGSIGALLKELEDKYKADGSVSEEYLADVLKRFTAIVGTEAFKADLQFIVDRLNTIEKVKAVVKGLLVVIAAALTAAIIGPAAGALAAEAGLGTAGVGLVAFGAEVLSFTIVSQIGNTLMFGRTDMGFFEELLHNAVTFGILKGVARIHRLAFAKFAEPKFYPKLFAATGTATQFISLYGLGMVQHALPPALGGKGRMMTAEEQGWMIVQNMALLGAMALASKITAPIREQLEQRTFDALTANAKEKLAALDINRQAIGDEVAAIRKLGVAADPVRRQRLINAIEQQFNSDIAWFKEALRIMERHPAVLGVDKAKVEQFIADYRGQVDKLVISMMENGYDFKPGGSDLVKFVEPGVIAYTGDAFKTGDVDPLTGEKREVIDLGDGNFEVKVGGRRMLYVPAGGLPVNVADPKGIRALVEYYKFDWETAKRAFGSDSSNEMNSLLQKAWSRGWRPGQPVPPEIQIEIFDHFRKLFDAEMDVYRQQVRNLPEPKLPSEEMPTEEKGEIVLVVPSDSPFRVPGPINRSELLSDAGIADEIQRFQRQLEKLLDKLNPDVRRGLVSLYVAKALSFLKAERGGPGAPTDYPPSNELLEAAPLMEKGGFKKYPALIELLLSDRKMLWLLFEFRDNPKKLLEHYETWLKKGSAQSFREYGRRFLFTDEFNRAEEKLRDHIQAERDAAKAQKQATSGKDLRSLQDRFGPEWKTGATEADRAFNNALLYKDSEPSILQAHVNGALPSHLSTAIDTALKGDHLAGIAPTDAESYSKARTKIVGIVNLALKDNIKSFADYLALIDRATQVAAIGRIGEGFTKAMETDVGLPSGGKKVTINLDAKTIAALNAARLADSKDPVFDADTKWVTIDLFYDSGTVIGEVKVGSSYTPLQFKRYATLVLYKSYLAAQFKAAGITDITKIFYVVLPGAEEGSAGTPDIQERQAKRIQKDAVSEGVDAVTTIRYITRDGSLYEQSGSATKTLIKKIQ